MSKQLMTDKKQHTIVAVDDDINLLNLLRRLLHKWYEVSFFQSPTNLLTSMDKIRPSLFIIDWMMPGVDGITLCREIRKQQRFDLVPISFYTGVNPTIDNIQKAYEAGAQAFISKAQDSVFIVAQVRALIDSYERMSHYLLQRAMMLSALKHELLNKLTGVTSGVEALAFHKAFRKEELKRQTITILNSSESLRNLIGDLSEVLAVEGRDHKKTIRHEMVSDVFADLTNYLADTRRKLKLRETDSLEVLCNRRSLGRALNAMVKLIHWIAPHQLPVSVKSRSQVDGILFEVTVPGCFKERLEEVISSADENPNFDAGPVILYVQYARNVLNNHRTSLFVAEEDGCTKLRFTIPDEPVG